MKKIKKVLVFLLTFSILLGGTQTGERVYAADSYGSARLVLESDGQWHTYFPGGGEWPGYVGLAYNDYGWFYCTDSVVDWGYTGMAYNEYGWWYVTNGCIDFNYTGMAYNQYGWWYFENGVLNTNYTGMACNEVGWFYYQNGQIVWDYTGMACNEYGWWYFQNGALNTNYTGMACNEYGWWYFRNGQIDFNYTGMACNEYGWWYFRNGQLDFNYTGMACNEYGWFYYRNGQIVWDYTGMACNEYGWWYFRNGYLDTEYTGIGQNEYGYWYYVNGQIAFNYSGKVNYDRKTYNVVNGSATIVAVAKDVDSSILDYSSNNYSKKYDLSAFDTEKVKDTQVYKRFKYLNLSMEDLANAPANKEAAERLIDSKLVNLPTEKVYYNGTTVGQLASGGLNDFLLANRGKVVVLQNDLVVNGKYDTIMIPSDTVLDGNNHAIILAPGGEVPDIAVSFYYMEEYVNRNISSNAGLKNIISYVNFKSAVNLWGADQILVENCYFENISGNGIVVKNNDGDNSQYVKIISNRIENCAGDAIAIYDNQSYVMVKGNVINRCAGRAGIMISCLNDGQPIRVDQELVGPHEIICESNFVSALSEGEGIYCIGTYKTYVLNNEIRDCYLEGTCIDYGCIGTWYYGNTVNNTGLIGGLPGLSLDNSLYNFVDSNTISQNTCDGIKLVRTADATLIVNNTIFGNNKNLAGSKVSSGIDIEPLEVEAGDGDRLDGYGSDGNIIMNNTITDHSVGVYIAEDSLTGTSVDNVVKNNTLRDCSYEYLVDFSSGCFNRIKESENSLE